MVWLHHVSPYWWVGPVSAYPWAGIADVIDLQVWCQSRGHAGELREVVAVLLDAGHLAAAQVIGEAINYSDGRRSFVQDVFRSYLVSLWCRSGSCATRRRTDGWAPCRWSVKMPQVGQLAPPQPAVHRSVW